VDAKLASQEPAGAATPRPAACRAAPERAAGAAGVAAAAPPARGAWVSGCRATAVARRQVTPELAAPRKVEAVRAEWARRLLAGA